MVIGERIKNLRTAKNISQEELGTIIGVSKVSICGYENNKRCPNLEIIIKLANYFETSIDYLLGREKKIYNEDDNKFVGYISEKDIELIYEIKHYPNLYISLMKDIPKNVKDINRKIK